MGRVIRKIMILLSGLMLSVLCGCASMSAEDFYALPQLSEGYLQLQNRIDEILVSGAEYSAPISGTNRQAVQLEDIDGDGVKEAIVFFRFIGSDKPQKIYVFRNVDGVYEEVARIEGDGSGIESINYADMDGDGIKEIAVGWQIASGMNMLTVYTMREFQPAMILNTDYTEYVMYDLDGNGSSDVIVLRLTASETGGEALMYTLTEEGETVNTMALLSDGTESLRRLRTGRLVDGYPSILIESTINGSGIITDILACKNGTITNITIDETLGLSDTVRSTAVYCRDINGDDTLEVPKLISLPSLSESTTYYLTEWYNYRMNGRVSKVCTTYNNYTDYWYLVIPDGWINVITVQRQDVLSGERSIVFSYIGNGLENAVDFLAIYTLSGDNREERAASGDRFVLAKDDETIYAAEILGGRFKIDVSEELIKERFGILYSEWQTGEM